GCGTLQRWCRVSGVMRSDVDHAVENSRKATLVCLGSIGVGARINGWASTEQCVGERSAAIVLKRTQLQLIAPNLAPVHRSRRYQDIRPANQVEATGGDDV